MLCVCVVQITGGNVVGSMFEKKKLARELKAYTQTLGPPHLYATFNPNDFSQPGVIRWATGWGNSDDAIPEFLREIDGLRVVAENPDAASKLFHRIIKAILEKIICGKKHGCGVFGNVIAYFAVVETQGRGTLHLHILMWLEGAGTSEGLVACIQENLNDFAKRYYEFIDTIICNQRERSGADQINVDGLQTMEVERDAIELVSMRDDGVTMDGLQTVQIEPDVTAPLDNGEVAINVAGLPSIMKIVNGISTVEQSSGGNHRNVDSIQTVEVERHATELVTVRDDQMMMNALQSVEIEPDVTEPLRVEDVPSTVVALPPIMKMVNGMSTVEQLDAALHHDIQRYRRRKSMTGK